jgi:hypothetical protein
VTPNRKVIYNGTFADKTAGISFRMNKGLRSDQINLTKKDTWRN